MKLGSQRFWEVKIMIKQNALQDNHIAIAKRIKDENPTLCCKAQFEFEIERSRIDLRYHMRFFKSAVLILFTSGSSIPVKIYMKYALYRGRTYA